MWVNFKYGDNVECVYRVRIVQQIKTRGWWIFKSEYTNYLLEIQHLDFDMDKWYPRFTKYLDEVYDDILNTMKTEDDSDKYKIALSDTAINELEKEKRKQQYHQNIANRTAIIKEE